MSKNSKIGIIGGLIVAVIGALVIYGVIGFVNSINEKAATGLSSNAVISGEYDVSLRQGCIEKMNSYGFGEVTEGQINLCVDTAKAFLYSELNK
jgi:hypothetical protein